MGKTFRLTAVSLLSLLFLAPEVSAQILRRPRPPRTIPEDSRPGLGIILGPTSRVSETATGGLDFAVTGELPLPGGYRARAELGAAEWATDPAAERGATRLTVTRATLGIYQLSGSDRVHSFLGGGFGLYRFRVKGAGGSGTKTGLFGGFGLEAAGRRHAASVEIRLTFAGGQREGEHVTDPHDTVLHGSILFGLKRVF
ncbi:MAG: hypothetical protein WD690_11230 [Vicinamibacterales bacterium]